MYSQIEEETAIKLLLCADCNRTMALDQKIPELLSLDLDQ